MRTALAAIGLFLMLAVGAAAQTTAREIGLYFGDWHDASATTLRGTLQERPILTRGDAFHPTEKGAVLRFINSYTYATLAPGARTEATRLQGQQEIYFVAAGKGTIAAGGQIADLFPNIAVLVPAGLSFTLQNTGQQPLGLYVINEPTPPDFRPNTQLLVRDENKLPITSTDGMWAHIVKTLFATQDGLATLQRVLTVTLDPLTMGKPHPAPGEDTDGIEEVWTQLEGTSVAMIGSHLYRQTPGMAYLHIPDNQSPHANINADPDTPVKFLYFARYAPHEIRK